MKDYEFELMGEAVNIHTARDGCWVEVTFGDTTICESHSSDSIWSGAKLDLLSGAALQAKEKSILKAVAVAEIRSFIHFAREELDNINS